MKNYIAFELRLNWVKDSDKTRQIIKQYKESHPEYLIQYGTNRLIYVALKGKIFSDISDKKSVLKNKYSLFKKDLLTLFTDFGIKSISELSKTEVYIIS